jgi:hypothetical protein
MSKIKPILIAASLFTVGLMVIAYLLFIGTAKDKVPAPEVTPLPTPSSRASSEELRKTKQFTDISFGDNQYGAFLLNGELNGVGAEELNLSIWTADQYVQKAILNPYFVSGYWATKDDLSSDSIKSYISPYLSEALSTSFLTEADEFKTKGSMNSLASKLFIPDPILGIPAQCYDTWENEYCFSSPYEVNNFAYTGQPDGSMLLEISITINPLYQKPDSAEGNFSSQKRIYDLKFSLSRLNEPTSNDTVVPIMIIDDITSTVSTNGLEDYLVNEG